jgi:hypothetical protein
MSLKKQKGEKGERQTPLLTLTLPSMSLLDDFLESTEPGGSSTLANYGDHSGIGGTFANDYPNDNIVRVSFIKCHFLESLHQDCISSY